MIQSKEKSIDYIEIATTDIGKAKRFFIDLFGWNFTDYGQAYTSFEDGRIAGGFYQSNKTALASEGSVLVVFYTTRLEDSLARCGELGASITRDIFSFPGGRRFHFIAPGGGEFAIWSDQ